MVMAKKHKDADLLSITCRLYMDVHACMCILSFASHAACIGADICVTASTHICSVAKANGRCAGRRMAGLAGLGYLHKLAGGIEVRKSAEHLPAHSRPQLNT